MFQVWNSDCRKKALMLEEVKELEHEDGEPIFDQPSNEVGGDFEEEEGLDRKAHV